MSESELKYEILEDPEHTKELPGGKIFHRIRALRDIPRHSVKAGDLGGWVMSKNNLDQAGDCWIKDTSSCADRSKMHGNSLLLDNSHLSGATRMFENAQVSNGSRLEGFVELGGNSVVTESSVVSGYVSITGESRIEDKANVNIGSPYSPMDIHNVCIRRNYIYAPYPKATTD